MGSGLVDRVPRGHPAQATNDLRLDTGDSDARHRHDDGEHLDGEEDGHCWGVADFSANQAAA